MTVDLVRLNVAVKYLQHLDVLTDALFVERQEHETKQRYGRHISF
jgi:hypothetical protein